MEYRIEPTGDVSARGSLSATETERGYTIEALGVGRGTYRDVYEAFQRRIETTDPFDAFGNPIDDEGIEITENPDSNGRYWTATVRYRRPELDAPDASGETSGDENAELVEYGFKPSSFSTTGGTARLTRSYETTAYPIEGTALDFGGGIGWNGEEFEGCDVVAPTFSFEVEATTPEGFVASFGSFANRIAKQVGTVNEDPFLGFLPGTVLFQGISSARRQTATGANGGKYDFWTLAYSFAASPHIELDVGGVSVLKPGWAYFWTLTEKSYDAATGEIVPFLRAAYVERVYRSTFFNLLSVGG